MERRDARPLYARFAVETTSTDVPPFSCTIGDLSMAGCVSSPDDGTLRPSVDLGNFRVQTAETCHPAGWMCPLHLRFLELEYFPEPGGLSTLAVEVQSLWLPPPNGLEHDQTATLWLSLHKGNASSTQHHLDHRLRQLLRKHSCKQSPHGGRRGPVDPAPPGHRLCHLSVRCRYALRDLFDGSQWSTQRHLVHRLRYCKCSMCQWSLFHLDRLSIRILKIAW